MDECPHGDPRPGRCALCRHVVKRLTVPSRYADTSPLPPKRRRRPARRITAAALSERTVNLWCATCVCYVPVTGSVYDTRSDAPVHVTPSDWTEHREQAHPR